MLTMSAVMTTKLRKVLKGHVDELSGGAQREARRAWVCGESFDVSSSGDGRRMEGVEQGRLEAKISER